LDSTWRDDGQRVSQKFFHFVEFMFSQQDDGREARQGVWIFGRIFSNSA